jgi:hypothetical protein
MYLSHCFQKEKSATHRVLVPKLHFIPHPKSIVFHSMLDFFFLKTKLGTTPMTSLGVILDGIVSTETNPLRKRTVLSLFLGKGAFGTESLLRWL